MLNYKQKRYKSNDPMKSRKFNARLIPLINEESRIYQDNQDIYRFINKRYCLDLGNRC